MATRDQRLIDAEVRETRRALLQVARRRGLHGELGFLDEEFLAVADRPTIYRAIVNSAMAVCGASSVDLQSYDAGTGMLRIVAQYGFDADFTRFFDSVDASSPTSCAAAFAGGNPVLVDDVARSAIFADQPTLEPLLTAGSRAVYSYPLVGTDVVGVLSFHHHAARPDQHRAALVAQAAARALA